jgi:hypothetical protein
MKELLHKAQFNETDWENEWSRGVWTIRIYKDEIEVFNEPRINTPGVYYKCATSIENLEAIIQEIEDRIK